MGRQRHEQENPRPPQGKKRQGAQKVELSAKNICEGLTGSEAREVLAMLLAAIARYDEETDPGAFVHRMQAACSAAERLAVGEHITLTNGRQRLNGAALEQIAGSTQSSYALANDYGVAASTIRAARRRMREAA